MLKRIAAGLLLAMLLSSCSINSRITKADKKFALGEYYRAAEMYRGIYPQVSTKKQRKLKGEVAFKMGNSYRLIENNKRAETGFKNALRYGCRDSMVYYYYAEVLRQQGRYKEAMKMYSRHDELFPGNALSAKGLESCDKALGDWKEKTDYVVSKPSVFNSRNSEFCPAFAAADADVLYFNSTRVPKGTKSKNSRITGQRNNEIYSAKQNARGKWEDPEALDNEEINTEYDEGACAFSPDFQTMYYTVSKVVKGETHGTAIYMCKRSGAEWSTPEPVKLVEDSTISVAHPALSPDDEYIYYASDMPGGHGGKDLWRSHRGRDGWEAPENLGPEINTAGDEMFPSFAPDGTLYFSSDGHESLGGLDIYRTYLEKDSAGAVRRVVENMRQPLNSRYDDFGITFAPGMKSGFFSSNRGDRKNYDHIYAFEIPVYEYIVKGVVADNNGNPVSDASVKIVGNDGSFSTVKVNKKGEYSINVRPETKYVMQASCRAYLNGRESLNVLSLKENTAFERNFVLSLVDRPIKMNDIFFKFGSAELTPESSAGLDDLVKLLNDNPMVTIEIGAHTDYIGSDEDNIKLSTDRARAVVDYLLAKGINEHRLKAVGYGESQPIVPDKALAKQYRFLREGVPLTEEYVLKLNEKQREVANQLNRRTEFKVTKTTFGKF